MRDSSLAVVVGLDPAILLAKKMAARVTQVPE